MIEFIRTNFSLPDGGLYSNLIASALLGLGGFIYGRAFERKAEARHNDLKEHISKKHQEMKQHVTEVHRRGK